MRYLIAFLALFVVAHFAPASVSASPQSAVVGHLDFNATLGAPPTVDAEMPVVEESTPYAILMSSQPAISSRESSLSLGVLLRDFKTMGRDSATTTLRAPTNTIERCLTYGVSMEAGPRRNC